MKRNKIVFIGDSSFDSFQSQMLAGAMKAAEEIDVNLVRFILENNLYSYRYKYSLEIIVKMLKKLEPDGIMFLGWLKDISDNIDKFLSLLKELGPVPLLSLGKGYDNITSLVMPGHKHLIELLEHFYYEHHYKNIVLIKPLVPDSRYTFYENFMKDHNLYKPELILSNEEIDAELDNDISLLHVQRVQRVLDILYKDRKVKVDAIISLYVYEAHCLLNELKCRGLKVPRDVAVGCWEDGERAKYASPPLTSVYFPFYEHAYEGCKILKEMIYGKEMPVIIEVPGKVSIRRSCGCDSKRIKKIKADNSSHIPQLQDTPLDIEKIKQELLNYSFQLKILDKYKLLDSFILELKEKNNDTLIKFIEDYIYGNNINTEYLYQIQEDILEFRHFINPFLENHLKEKNYADNLWLKCQIFIEENIEAVIGKEEVVKLAASYFQQEIGQDIVVTLDIKKVMGVLASNLDRLEIRGCSLFLFNGKKDLMGQEKLIFQSRDGITRMIDTKLSACNKANSLQTILAGNERHINIVYLLHIKEELMGFILFEPGQIDERIYYSLSTEISSAIHGALVLNNLKKANVRLKSAQNKIIENMKEIQEKTTALEDSNKKLSSLDKLKNDFIANITHSFRSSLMIILNSAELGMQNDKLEDHENIIRRYNTIYNASTKLKMSIDCLLDLARMDAQGIKLNIKKVALKNYMKNIIDFYSSASMNSGIKIYGQLPDYEILNFFTDLEKLEDILHNIITNALKFVDPKNGVITIFLLDKKSSVEINIKDNGIGIPVDKLGSIFDRFEQVEDGRNSRYKGTGIGLAFVKELVGYLRGTIKAESDGPGKGANFILEFKKEKDIFADQVIEDEPEQEYVDNEKRKEFQKIVESNIYEKLQKDEIKVDFRVLNQEHEFDEKKAIILLIDDNTYICEIVKEYLSRTGYQNFITTFNGIDGLEAIYKYRPDLIISDYNMPKMRGDELHDRLISNLNFQMIPIIFLSALNDKDIMLERKQKGALAYLKKPLDEKELLVSVEIHLKKYMEYRQLLEKASTDELTGLANKQTILNIIHEHIKDYIVHNTSKNFSILFMDIDHFKNFNDSYGHPAGDTLLSHIGKIIKNFIRSNDHAGRFGGEEFLVLLPDTSIDKAKVLAERLRHQIEKEVINLDQKILTITASFGAASLQDFFSTIKNPLKMDNLHDMCECEPVNHVIKQGVEDSINDIQSSMLELADRALYEAKISRCLSCSFKSVRSEDFLNGKCPGCGSRNIHFGRNKVVIFGDTLNC